MLPRWKSSSGDDSTGEDTAHPSPVSSMRTRRSPPTSAGRRDATAPARERSRVGSRKYLVSSRRILISGRKQGWGNAIQRGTTYRRP